MKQTVTLSNSRKATIDIPLEKLAQAQTSRTPQHNQDCECKVVVTGGGRNSNNAELRMLVEELEIAYDKDVTQLQQRISELERENKEIRDESERKLAQLRKEHEEKCKAYQKTIKDLQAKNYEHLRVIQLLKKDVEFRDKQIERLKREIEVLLRNKITEFKHTEYIVRIQEQERRITLLTLQNKELNDKIQAIQLENLKNEEAEAKARQELQARIVELTKELEEAATRSREEQVKVDKVIYVKDQQAEKAVAELNLKIEAMGRIITQYEQAGLAKDKQIVKLSESLCLMEDRLKQGELESMTIRDGSLSAEAQKQMLSDKVIVLTEKVTAQSEAIAFLDEEKGRLLLQLQESYDKIQQLKKEYDSKEKVYEVKIERVVDGKEQIQQLQLAIFELEQQLKLINGDKEAAIEEVRRREIALDGLRAELAKLNAEITQLKGYIKEKEKSFRWTVEREIEKDISVTVGQHPGSYRVSQTKQYQRDKYMKGSPAAAQAPGQPIDSPVRVIEERLAGNLLDQLVIEKPT